MKGFLRFVGVVELLAYFVGIILLAINLNSQFVTIFYFALYIIFAPTIGILCLCVASLLESREYLEERIQEVEKKLGIKVIPKDISKDANNDDLDYVIAKKDIVDGAGRQIKEGTKGILLSKEGRTARVRFEGNGKAISYIDSEDIKDYKNKQ